MSQVKDVHNRRRAFVSALNAMDAYWSTFLQEQDFYDLNYSDLFTGLWLRERPVSKTEAASLIRQTTPQTAMKYIRRATEKGYLLELPNPDDKRSRLIVLAPSLQEGLEDFFDYAIETFTEALQVQEVD